MTIPNGGLPPDTGVQDPIDEVVVEGRQEKEPSLSDVPPIADVPHIEVDFDGDVCGYQPIAKKGAFTLGGKGCADIFDRAASTGISATFAPEKGIIGPIKSVTLTAEAEIELSGDRSKIATASVEIATPLKGIHLEVDVSTKGEGGPKYGVGIIKPF